MFHSCWRLILKDLWAEIFFASAASAATLIVKTEQVTIRMWKEEDGTDERGRGHKASRRFKIRDNGSKSRGAVFWSANHRCFVLYVLLLLDSLRDVDKQF